MKIAWEGEIVSVQPRIRLTRSFDQRSHTYLGYALRVSGAVDGRFREFSVGIGKAAQAKHRFQARDRASGETDPVADPRLVWKVIKGELAKGNKPATVNRYLATCDQRIKSGPLALQRFLDQQLTRTPVASFAAPCSTLRN